MSGYPERPHDPLLIWSNGVRSYDTLKVLAIAALEGEADHYLGQIAPVLRQSRQNDPNRATTSPQLSPDYADYGIESTIVAQAVADTISEVMDRVAADAGPAFDASLEDHDTRGLHDYALFLLEGAARLREETP